MFTTALKLSVIPPLSLFLLAAFGFVLGRWRPRAGRWIVALAVVTLVALTLPVVSTALQRSLQSPIAPEVEWAGAGAIVILAADFLPRADEYGGATVGPLTLERVRYGGLLSRRTGLPVLVSGGTVKEGSPPIAAVMKSFLERELGMPVRWTEERSRTTRENALETARLLKSKGVSRVLLVTHAWHMPRARFSFEAAGLDVVAAPTGFRHWPDSPGGALLPSAKALQQSAWALHEWIGLLWYRLRG